MAVTMHFNFQGPRFVNKVEWRTQQSSDDKIVHIRYEATWTAHSQQTGHTREEVISWVGHVLNHSLGWARANVNFRLVQMVENALVVVQFAPKSEIKGGIAQTGPVTGPPQKRLIKAATDRFGPPFFALWWHEIAHAVFTAQDMYLLDGPGQPHFGYHGIMGNNDHPGSISDNYLMSVRQWLRGKGVVHQHH